MNPQVENPIVNDGAVAAPAPDGEGCPAAPGSGLDAPRSTSAGHDALVRMRQERITAFLDESLKSPMAEVGLVGGVTADLASVELKLNLALEEVLAECKTGREYLDAAPGGMEMILKVARQIERYARLMRDIAQPRPAGPQVQIFGRDPLASAQSEETPI